MNCYETKAGALVTAWRRRYDGCLPTKHAARLVGAVAEHETRCGDSWPGEHNWGAFQRRPMTGAERALVRAGKACPPRDAFEALHGDGSPVSGRDQGWFWRFPNDVEGASKLLEVPLDKRPSIQRDIDTLRTDELARRMYVPRYDEVFHDPRPAPGEEVPPGGLTKGQAANVRDYARGLARAFARFDEGLAAWTRYQRKLARIERRAERRREASRRERRQESDEAVERNIPPELLPLWRQVRRTFQSSERKSRTEAFLQYAEENPDEVLGEQQAEAERQLCEWQRQVAEQRRKHKGTTRAARRPRSPTSPFDAPPHWSETSGASGYHFYQNVRARSRRSSPFES